MINILCLVNQLNYWLIIGIFIILMGCLIALIAYMHYALDHNGDYYKRRQVERDGYNKYATAVGAVTAIISLIHSSNLSGLSTILYIISGVITAIYVGEIFGELADFKNKNTPTKH